jgi:hypothetical protein
VTVESVDHKARHDAAIALDRMNKHEERCTERWQQARAQGVRVERILWSFAVGTGSALFAVIIMLLSKH